MSQTSAHDEEHLDTATDSITALTCAYAAATDAQQPSKTAGAALVIGRLGVQVPSSAPQTHSDDGRAGQVRKDRCGSPWSTDSQNRRLRALDLIRRRSRTTAGTRENLRSSTSGESYVPAPGRAGGGLPIAHHGDVTGWFDTSGRGAVMAGRQCSRGGQPAQESGRTRSAAATAFGGPCPA